MDDQTEVEKVRVAIRRTRGTREHDRIVAISMVRINGFAIQVVADILCVDRGTVHNWLNAYARNGLDGLVDDQMPGRPPFVPRAELEVMVGDTKRFTTYEFVELVKKKTGIKYSEPHARRLLRSLGFAVKKALQISDYTSSRTELEIWQKDMEKEVETLENDGFTLVMADESHQTYLALVRPTYVEMQNQSRCHYAISVRPYTAASH